MKSFEVGQPVWKVCHDEMGYRLFSYHVVTVGLEMTAVVDKKRKILFVETVKLFPSFEEAWAEKERLMKERR